MASGLPCFPVAETRPRSDETQFPEKIRARSVNIFPYSFVSIFLVCIDSSTLVPVRAARNPNTVCNKLRLLHFGQLFSPCRASRNVTFHTFPAFVVFSELWSFTFSLRFYFFAASSASHTPICFCWHTQLRSMLLCFHFLVFKGLLLFSAHNISIPPPVSENLLRIVMLREPPLFLAEPCYFLRSTSLPILLTRLLSHCLR